MEYPASAKRFFIDRKKCLGCRTCELRCAVERGSVSKNLALAAAESPPPRSRVYVHTENGESVAVHCSQCDLAPCLSACSTGALAFDPETGVRYINGERCIGCWMCVMACPYGLITPAPENHAAEKCDQCYLMNEPYCLAACPTGAIRLLSREEWERATGELRTAALSEQKI